MPFLTEELWQRLAAGRSDRPVSIALAEYPQYRSSATDHAAEREIGILQEIVTLARNVRAENKLDHTQQVEGTLYSHGNALDIARKHAEAIQRLANVKLGFETGTAPRTAAMRSTAEFDLVLQLPKAQEGQSRRKEKEREQLLKNIENSERQLSDEVFLAKAPPKVVETIRKKLEDYRAQLHKLNGSL